MSHRTRQEFVQPLVYSMTCLENTYLHGYEHGVLARRAIGSVCDLTSLSPRLCSSRPGTSSEKLWASAVVGRALRALFKLVERTWQAGISLLRIHNNCGAGGWRVSNQSSEVGTNGSGMFSLSGVMYNMPPADGSPQRSWGPGSWSLGSPHRMPVGSRPARHTFGGSPGPYSV